jgi:putative transposase
MIASELNLPAPPGFFGLHPDRPLRRYFRHLPHWRQDNATYFVTFRLADSIPQPQLQALQRWRRIWLESHPEPRSESQWHEFAKEITQRTERYLDHGYGECVFRDSELAATMGQSLVHFQDEHYLTSSYVVMPNHVHLTIQPFAKHELEDILESLKGFVSRHVNKVLGRSGKLWEEESYDRIIRDEEHLFRTIQYIGRNGAKAGLDTGSYRRWIHPDWEKLGWGFRDAEDESNGSKSEGPKTA